MDRQTRREHFERICALRDAYGRLGPADTTSVITIERAISWASRVLARSIPATAADVKPAG
ncbi:MAG: hypothetical protein H0V73_02170 [Chloroflexi bacterium]|nr:hypothetical protein [Chloroflexota bacterium]